MIERIRDYYFDTFGEAIRGVEIVIAVVLLSAVQDLENVTDLRRWGVGAATAALVAGAAYVKGRLPASSNTESEDA